MPFDNWRKRLEIAQKYPTVALRRHAIAALGINFAQPSPADEGYYRKAITVKHENGNGRNVVTGWIPVAYFMQDGELIGLMGNADDGREINVNDEELWSYVVANPIPYEWYQAVAERGEAWPDAPDPAAEQEYREMERGAEIDARRTQENTPEPPAEEKPPEDPPHVRAAKAIDTMISATASLTVTSVEEEAIAEGSKNRLAELRLRVDKAGKAEYQPLHAAYVAKRDQWLPPVNRAEAAEKGIARKILAFRESERRRIAAEQAEAAKALQEEAERNARAADRAIARGEEPPPPEIDETIVYPTQPTAPVVPTHGKRTTKSQLKKFAVIDDGAKVYEFFKNNADVVALLEKLATDAIRAGVEVPGTTTDERLA